MLKSQRAPPLMATFKQGQNSKWPKNKFFTCIVAEPEEPTGPTVGSTRHPPVDYKYTILINAQINESNRSMAA